MTKDSDKAAAKSAKKKKAASSGEREKETAPTSNPDSDDEIVTLTQNTLDNLAKTIATAVATATTPHPSMCRPRKASISGPL